MKKFKVIVEEHITQEYEIEANDIGEALANAETKYYNGELVVDNGELSHKLMSAYDPETKESTEWSVF